MALYSNLRPSRLDGLSLCSGAGGLELGLAIAARSHRTVCYVERDAFAAATLVARMADKALDCAPLWSDLATFDGCPWRGRVDIITAGYPCQPFTLSGKRKGTKDLRHLWPEVRRIIAQARPRLVFCENVEGHLTLGFPEVAASLQGMGYGVRAGLFSAAECGAAHQRRRLFILAYADRGHERQPGGFPSRRKGLSPAGNNRDQGQADRPDRECENLDAAVADGQGPGHEGRGDAEFPLFAPAPCQLAAWQQALERQPSLQPCLFGLDHGLAHRVERSMLAGNGVSPLAAALAFRTLGAGIADDVFWRAEAGGGERP